MCILVSHIGGLDMLHLLMVSDFGGWRTAMVHTDRALVERAASTTELYHHILECSGFDSIDDTIAAWHSAGRPI